MKKTKKYTLVGVLSAMAFVLFLFPKFPILAAFPWLELDLSDVPALFASVSISPFFGFIVVLIKNVLHLPLTSTGMIGELSNLLINGTFALATGIVFKYSMKSVNKFSSVLYSVLTGASFQIMAAVVVNRFIMIPMYSAFVNFEEMGGAEKYILAGVVPFNAIKDFLAGVAFICLYKALNNKFFNKNAK